MNARSDLKVLIGHAQLEVRGTLESAITEMSYEISAVCASVAELLEKAKSNQPDVILSGVEFADGDAVSGLIELGKDVAIPAVIVTPKRSLALVEKALQDHVWAYLLEPVKAEEIQPTIYLVLRRFEQFEEMRSEVEDLKQALGDRKIIERAKGLLMTKADLTEDEAYHRLRRMATDKRAKLVEIAQQVIDVEELTQSDEMAGA